MWLVVPGSYSGSRKLAAAGQFQSECAERWGLGDLEGIDAEILLSAEEEFALRALVVDGDDVEKSKTAIVREDRQGTCCVSPQPSMRPQEQIPSGYQ